MINYVDVFLQTLSIFSGEKICGLEVNISNTKNLPLYMGHPNACTCDPTVNQDLNRNSATISQHGQLEQYMIIHDTFTKL
jgi:hypothetical protein